MTAKVLQRWEYRDARQARCHRHETRTQQQQQKKKGNDETKRWAKRHIASERGARRGRRAGTPRHAATLAVMQADSGVQGSGACDAGPTDLRSSSKHEVMEVRMAACMAAMRGVSGCFSSMTCSRVAKTRESNTQHTLFDVRQESTCASHQRDWPSGCKVVPTGPPSKCTSRQRPAPSPAIPRTRMQRSQPPRDSKRSHRRQHTIV